MPTSGGVAPTCYTPLEIRSFASNPFLLVQRFLVVFKAVRPSTLFELSVSFDSVLQASAHPQHSVHECYLLKAFGGVNQPIFSAR